MITLKINQNAFTINTTCLRLEINPDSQHVLNLLAIYKTEFLDWEPIHLESRIALEKEREYLNQKEAKGITIPLTQWNSLTRELEDLNVSRKNKLEAKERLGQRIKFLVTGLFNHFVEMETDVVANIIQPEAFSKYLIRFGELFKASNGLDCFNQPPADMIKSAIEDYVTKTIAA